MFVSCALRVPPLVYGTDTSAMAPLLSLWALDRKL